MTMLQNWATLGALLALAACGTTNRGNGDAAIDAGPPPEPECLRESDNPNCEGDCDSYAAHCPPTYVPVCGNEYTGWIWTDADGCSLDGYRFRVICSSGRPFCGDSARAICVPPVTTTHNEVCGSDADGWWTPADVR